MKDHRSYQNPEKLNKPLFSPFTQMLQRTSDPNPNPTSHSNQPIPSYPQSYKLPHQPIYEQHQPYLPSNRHKEFGAGESDLHYSGFVIPRTYSLKIENDPAFIQLNKSQVVQNKKEAAWNPPTLRFAGVEGSGKGFSKINSAREMVGREEGGRVEYQNETGWQKEADSPTFSPTYTGKGVLQWSVKKRKSKKSDEIGSIKKGLEGDKIIEVIPIEDGKPVNIVNVYGKDSNSRARRLSNNQYLKATTHPNTIVSPSTESNSSPKTESKMIRRDYSCTALSSKDTKPNLGSPFSASQYNQSNKTRYFDVPTEPDTPSSQRKLIFKDPTKKDFWMGKILGRGRFGDVYVAKHKQIGFVCAMKVMSKKTILEEDFVNQFCREVTIQMYLKHCNIAALYGMFDDEENVYLLMELCMDGQLYKVMKASRPMQEHDAVNLIKQICLGTEYLHRENIIHRDLKPQNIIMHENLVKICDFGWAVHNKDNMRDTFCGTPLFLSPEMLKGENYCEKIDNWAIGMISYEMIVGKPAFKIQTQKELEKILVQEIEFPEYYEISDLAKEFVLGLLERDDGKRMEIEEALGHPFLTRD